MESQKEHVMTKKTPFYDVNLEYGAKMREMFGYFLPWEYAPGHFEEHLGTRQRASLCDLSYMAFFKVEGSEAINFLQKLCTNDFRHLAIGAHRYTAICDDNGNMIDDGTVWRLGETSFLIITGDEADYDWITRNTSGFKVEIRSITSVHTTLALQGPNSHDVLSEITDVDLTAIQYYHFTNGRIADVECLFARMGFTGEFGYEVHFPPQHGGQIWNAIMNAGAEYRIVPCGQAALESLRQEAGYILVGNEHDNRTNPLEAGIGWTVKFAKDEFNGKQALLDIARQGVKRRLVWFSLPGGEVAKTGDAIFSGDKQIGSVTSGSFSPTFKAGTALGYVAPQYAIPGVTFEIEVAQKRSKAKLSVMPLYDPGDRLTKGNF